MKKVVTAIALFCTLIGSVFASDSTKVDFKKNASTKAVKLALDKKRTVVLKGIMTSNLIDQLIFQMKQMAILNKKDIYLVINSPGGNVVNGFELVTLIQSLKTQEGINTICVVESEAYSMAAITALYCHKTYMQRRSNIMFHEATYGVQGTPLQVINRVLFSNTYLEGLEKNVAAQMGLSYEDYHQRIINEWWSTAEQATKIGLVDGIVDQLIYFAEPPKEDLFQFLIGNNISKNMNVVISPLKTIQNERLHVNN